MDLSSHPLPSLIDSSAGERKEISSSSSTTETEALLVACQLYARNKIEQYFEGSNNIPLLDKSSGQLARFDKREIKLGTRLGKGGCCSVYEALAFEEEVLEGGPRRRHCRMRSRFMATSNDEPVNTEEQMESRKFISKHCIRNGGGDARYAVKMLSPETLKGTGIFVQAIMDLAIETRVLNSLVHPNIIKLHAVAMCDAYQPEYFLVLDRLYDTLEKRLKKWTAAREKKRSKGGRRAMAKLLLLDCKGRGLKDNKLLEERLVVAFDISSALEYMHEHGILYREIKPDNLGFDIHNDIKIFDFGFSRALRDRDRNADGTYNLTGFTGSPRYMAPEVALSKPYNASSDVYSFAILLWEMLALQRPFELYSLKTMKAKVWEGGRRPRVDDKWSDSIKLLLRRSWSADVAERPTMADNTQVLRKECVQLCAWSRPHGPGGASATSIIDPCV